MDRTLWTIGYEKTSFAAVLAALRAAGVDHLIDTRDLPLSRVPGFSKRQLAAGLAEAGVGYTHLRPLGTPPEGREANKRKNWPLFWDIVDRRLATPEAQDALVQAGDIAAASRTCLLCYEADHRICHRTRVGELLTQRHGFGVMHLSAAGRPGTDAAMPPPR